MIDIDSYYPVPYPQTFAYRKSPLSHTAGERSFDESREDKIALRSSAATETKISDQGSGNVPLNKVVKKKVANNKIAKKKVEKENLGKARASEKKMKLPAHPSAKLL